MRTYCWGGRCEERRNQGTGLGDGAQHADLSAAAGERGGGRRRDGTGLGDGAQHADLLLGRGGEERRNQGTGWGDGAQYVDPMPRFCLLPTDGNYPLYGLEPR